MRIAIFFILIFFFNFKANADNSEYVYFEGDLKQWHKATFNFKGPYLSEDGEVNPFTDYRLNLFLKNKDSNKLVKIPGYFTADGNAANTGASSGNIWQVNFNAPEKGYWEYRVEFVKGKNIAANPDKEGQSAGFFDGLEGTINITESDKESPDFRAKGHLEYVNENYLQFKGDKTYFIKTGINSPENFLAFNEFDNTKPTHKYRNHLKNWEEVDPIWKNDKGKAIIGAVNYLYENGVNSIYMIPMNIGGDGKDVSPFSADWKELSLLKQNLRGVPENLENSFLRYDISKLAQWEIVFEHMQEKGIMIHFQLQETENDHLMDSGDLRIIRSIYYRELIARFGHHNAITWNLGEENTNGTDKIKEFSTYISSLLQVNHNIVIHSYPNEQRKVYNPLLGFKNITGTSIQGKIWKVTNDTLEWLKKSNSSGQKWVVSHDEIGPHDIGAYSDKNSPDNHDELMDEVIYGNLMSGGAGFEWYFGYKEPHNDLNLEDFSSREKLYNLSRIAREFFQKYIPFQNMEAKYNFIKEDGYVFAEAGEFYLIYLKNGNTINLDLSNIEGSFDVYWFDPSIGGELITSDVTHITGGGLVSLGYNPIKYTENSKLNNALVFLKKAK